MHSVTAEPPEISVIVPTLNEAENLPLLVPRIDAALRPRPYEVIVVDDDSRDDTPRVCAALAERFPLTLIVRRPPKDGLSGAVLAGMAAARGATFVVMDADLQHPPEKIPELLAALDAGGDFVMGSRYVPGASTAEQWGPLRRLNSWAATALARPFAGDTHDPMSGFFALRRSTYASAERLTPLGYKIALELMCKARARDVREVPIHFGLRERGRSKLTATQQFRYLEHLSRLYDFTFPRASPIAKFAIATGCAWAAAFVVYVLLHGAMGNPWAVTLAYPVAIVVTALFHLRYVRTQREFLVTPHPWRDFWIIAAAEWAACAAAAAWLWHRTLHPRLVETFVLSFGAATVVRYVLRKEFLQDVRGLRREIRRDELAPNNPPFPAAEPRPLPRER
jgi:dolichol-phosphate mannosyltransferase